VYYHSHVGLRETKKQQTREQIASAAMGLFARRGFDGVTVAEIAEASGVSEKTVFNYFPTKEDVFFDETPARLAALASAVRERKPGQSVVAALHALQAGSADRLASPEFATFARIIEESPALQVKELEVMAQFAETLAGTLRSELGLPDLDARIAANALVSAHWQVFRNARRAALEGRHGPAAARRLRTELDRAYALLDRGLGALET
jgi:AcrR family transcriptional regulator